MLLVQHRIHSRCSTKTCRIDSLLPFVSTFPNPRKSLLLIHSRTPPPPPVLPTPGSPRIPLLLPWAPPHLETLPLTLFLSWSTLHVALGSPLRTEGASGLSSLPPPAPAPLPHPPASELPSPCPLQFWVVSAGPGTQASHQTRFQCPSLATWTSRSRLDSAAGSSRIPGSLPGPQGSSGSPDLLAAPPASGLSFPRLSPHCSEDRSQGQTGACPSLPSRLL